MSEWTHMHLEFRFNEVFEVFKQLTKYLLSPNYKNLIILTFKADSFVITYKYILLLKNKHRHIIYYLGFYIFFSGKLVTT